MADDDEILDQDYDPRPESSSSQPWLNLLEDAEKKFRDWQDKSDSIDELYADLNAQSAGFRDREFAMFWANINVLGPSVYARPPVPVVVPQFKDRDPVKIATSEMLERSLVTSYGLTDIDQVMRLIRDDMLIVGRGVVWVRYEDKGEVADNAGTQTTGERCCVEFLDRRDFLHAPARTWPEVDWVARCAWLTRKEGRKRFGEAALEAGYIVPHEGSSRLGKPREGSSPEEKAPFWEIWHKGHDKVVWVTEGVEEVLDQGKPHLRLEGFFPCPRPAYGTVQRRTLIPVPDFVFYKDQLEEINKLTARIHALSDAVQVKGFYPGGGEIGEAVEAALNINDNRKIMIPVSNFSQFSGGDPIIWLPIKEIGETIAGLIEMRRAIIDDVYQIVGLSDIMRGSTEATETLGAQQLKSQYGSIRIRDKQHELVRVARDATRICAEIMAEEFSRETLLSMSQMTLPTDAEIQKQVAAIKQQVMQGAQQLQQQIQMLQMQAVQSQLQGPSVPPGSEAPQAPGGPGAPPQGPPGGPLESGEQEGPDIEAQVQQLQEQAQQALQGATKAVQDLQSQATVEDCMKLLRDGRLSPFALDIETDSTIQPDEDAEKERRAEFLQVFGGLMQQLAALVEARPEAAEFAGEVLKFGLAPYRVGRSLEGAIDKFVEQLEQSAQGEKPPSPEEIKAQAEAQKMMAEQAMKQEELKAKAATEIQKMQYEWQMQQAEQEAKREEMLAEATLKQRESEQKMLLEQQKHQAEMEKQRVEMVKLQKEIEAKDADQQIKREDMQMKRRSAEQDFDLKSRSADHDADIKERSFGVTAGTGGGKGSGKLPAGGKGPAQPYVTTSSSIQKLGEGLIQNLALNQAQTAEMMKAIAQMSKSLSAPKRVIRGPDGRVAGVESVTNGAGR